MLGLARTLLTPFRVIFILLIVLAIGMATGRINLFSTKAHAAISSNCIDRVCEVVDVCPNIEGIQATVPKGMLLNSDGFCVADTTTTTTDQGTQPLTPSVGSPPDVCPNLPDYQLSVPPGYHKDDKTGDCILDQTPKVLGESTTNTTQPQTSPGDPQVLGASTSAPIGK